MDFAAVLASSRNYYDRNPTASGLLYLGAGVGPHGKTSRASYTVAAGKKALLEALFAQVIRDTAAVASGSTYVTIEVTDGVVTDAPLLGSRINDNTVNAQLTQVVAGPTLLLPADVVNIYTYDTSNGGTMSYWGTAKYTQYDG